MEYDGFVNCKNDNALILDTRFKQSSWTSWCESDSYNPLCNGPMCLSAPSPFSHVRFEEAKQAPQEFFCVDGLRACCDLCFSSRGNASRPCRVSSG